LKYIGYGVPQGAPTSCSTSVLALKKLERAYPQSVFYADDGLISCDNKPQITDLQSGIEENEAKSGWVKRNGVFLRPLRFLGFTYEDQPYMDPLSKVAIVVMAFLVDGILGTFLALTLSTMLFLWSLPQWRPRIRASTRKGATLEFDEPRAFLAWLLRGVAAVEGSAGRGYKMSPPL